MIHCTIHKMNYMLFEWLDLNSNHSYFYFSAMLGVYTLFWLKLNMFEALKWMCVPGLLTFFFGHRLLSFMAEQRKA